GDPNGVLGWSAAVDRRKGNFDSGVEKLRRLAQLDPRAKGIPHNLALSFLWTRQYEDADRSIARALSLAPDSDVDLVLRPFLYELWKGDTGPAKAFLREVAPRLETWARLGGEENHSLVLDEFGYWLVMLMIHNPRESIPVLDSLKVD